MQKLKKEHLHKAETPFGASVAIRLAALKMAGEKGKKMEMNMIILNSGKELSADSILRKHGFVDATPEISLFTHKIFEKNNKKYRFIGWDHLDSNRNWQDIKIKEI